MLWHSRVLGTPILVKVLPLMCAQSSRFQLGSSGQVASRSASLTTFGENLDQSSESVTSCLDDVAYAADLDNV